MRTVLILTTLVLILSTTASTGTLYTAGAPVILHRSDSLHYVVWLLHDSDYVDATTLVAWGCQPEKAGTWISSYVPIDSTGEFADAEFVVIIRWGDLDMDGQFNVADLTLMINVLFLGGEIP